MIPAGTGCGCLNGRDVRCLPESSCTHEMSENLTHSHFSGFPALSFMSSFSATCFTLQRDEIQRVSTWPDLRQLFASQTGFCPSSPHCSSLAQSQRRAHRPCQEIRSMRMLPRCLTRSSASRTPRRRHRTPTSCRTSKRQLRRAPLFLQPLTIQR